MTWLPPLPGRRSLLPLAAAALAAPTAPAQTQVWIVDAAAGPGHDFTTIEAAFAGAGDGDVLVFRPGSYLGPFFETPTLDGKGLVLVAESTATLATVRVQNLAPDQRFAARGFRGAQGGIDLVACAGPVWLEDLAVDPGSTDPLRHWDVDVAQCPSVALNRCDLLGLPAFTLFNAPAVRVAGGALHAFDSTLTGGAGFFHPAPTLTPGRPGLELFDSFAFASGTTFVPGILSSDAAVQSGASDSVFLDCVGEMVVEGGTHTPWPGIRRSFEATAIAREGESVTLRWTGAPGELAILNLSLAPGGLFLPQFNGSGVLGLPLLLVDGIGAIPGGGTLDVQVPIPELGAGVEGVVFYAQGSFADLGAGVVRLGGGSLIVLLDGAL